MKLASGLSELTLQQKSLTAAERAELCCERARRFEDAGDYAAAYAALIEYWPDRSKPPVISGLPQSTQGDLLLRIGNVAALLESADQMAGTQDTAKNLITKSIELFEETGRPDKVAQARADLAMSYWREGEFDEARVLLKLVL